MYGSEIALIVLGLLGIAALVLTLPIVALVMAVKARRRVRLLEAQLGALERELALRRSPAAKTVVLDTAPGPDAPAEAPPQAFPSAETPEPAPVPTASAQPPKDDHAVADEATPPEETGLPPPERPRPAAAGPGTLEERIGLYWFWRIGAIAILLGAAFGFKLGIDEGWIGPWGRVGIGWGAGAGFLALGAWLARSGKTKAVFVQGILGLGLALLLVSSYASFAFYKLLPLMGAFALVAFLAIFGGVLAAAYRAESVLVLSLVAAFCNPVLLSTGVDRPFALFSYLLVMTSAALVVAVRLRFRVATWTALAGITVLFAGWYERFFDAAPPPPPGTVDRPPEELMGPYHPLATRWAPLLFAVLFPLQWTLVGWWARRRELRHTAVALVLAAAVGAHAAAAALLFDRPVLLGGVMCTLAIGFGLLLTRLRQANWLGLPMAASFVVLSSLTGRIEPAGLLPMMLLTGGWSALYFGFFFRRAWKEQVLSSRSALLLLGGAGIGLALLCGLWLTPEHATLLGLLVTILSVVYLLLALLVRSVVTLVAAFVASLAGLAVTGVVSCAELPEIQTGLLAVAAAWMLVYVAFVAVDLFVRGSPWSPGRLAVLAGAGIGFCTLFLAATPESARLLRAMLSLGTGVVYLLVGLRMTNSRGGARNASTALLPLGLALVLFTMAVAFLFSGVTVTVIWAVEGVVLAYLASLERRPAWLAGSLAVFVACVVRMFALDFFWIQQQADLFWTTEGAGGTVTPVAFLHPRAWALAALGAGLLLAAWNTARKRANRFFGGFALGAAVAGHLAVLTLLVCEFRILLTTWPDPPPAGLPWEEFRAMLSVFENAVWAQAPRLDVVVTVVMGAYAAVLLVIGFAARGRLHRLLGIGLFGITIGKLALYDIWDLGRAYQVIVLVSVGVLLLAGGYLYARFGKRLRTLLTDGDSPTMLAVLVAAALLALAGPDAAAGPAGGRNQPAPYAPQMKAPIEGVTAPGDHCFAVTPELYAASRSRPVLADVRIVDSRGRLVPHVVRAQAGFSAASMDPPWQEATLVDPVTLPDGAFRAVLDLGEHPRRHRQVDLGIEGSDYLRPTRLESSDDGKTWGLLAEGAYVFDVSTGGPRAVRTRITHPASDARWLRVTLLTGSDKQHPRIRAARAGIGAEPAREHPEATVELAIRSSRQAEPGRTLIELTPLPHNLPLEELSLAVAGQPENRSFVRRVRVEGSTRKHAWFPVGGGVIVRVEGDENLRLPVEPGDRPHLRLWIENGDNQPLEIQQVRGHYPAREILFRTPAAGPHTLTVGSADARAPRYDLAELLQRGGPVQPRQVRLGAFVAYSAVPGTAEQAEAVPFSERYAWVIQLIIGVIVLALSLWTVALIRKNRRTPS